MPTKPPAYDRNGISVDDLIDFTPELRNQALTLVKNYKIGPIFTPPVVSTAPSPLATLTISTNNGGTNWAGGLAPIRRTISSSFPRVHPAWCRWVSWPRRRMFPTWAISAAPPASRRAPAKEEQGPEPERTHSSLLPRPDRPTRATFLACASAPPVQGMPMIKPPYGRLTAIDLDKGDFKWQIPFGPTPDSVRNNPALKGVTLAPTGETGLSVGTLVTKTLLIAGDGALSVTASGARGANLHAYDKLSGNEVASVYLPAPQSGSPMTYMLKGQQYIAVAISGGAYSGEYIAFRLPSE